MSATPVRVRRLEAERAALPPGVDPGGTRGAILDAALRLIADRGFAGTSIRDIAAAAEVQSATLYTHFPSKEHVLADLIRIGHEEHFRCCRDAILESQPEPAAQLRALMRAHVRMHATYPMLAVVTNAELHMLSAELGASAFELRQQAVQLIEDVVRRGVERGVFHVPHTWLATAAIGAMGLRVAHWFTPDFELDVEAVADVYATFALRVVGFRGEESA